MRRASPGTAQPGSGIGLSLVARIAQSHGAAVEVAAGIDGAGLAMIRSFQVWLAPEHGQRWRPGLRTFRVATTNKRRQAGAFPPLRRGAQRTQRHTLWW